MIANHCAIIFLYYLPGKINHFQFSSKERWQSWLEQNQGELVLEGTFQKDNVSNMENFKFKKNK